MPAVFICRFDSPKAREDMTVSVERPVERTKVIDSFSDATYPELVSIEETTPGFHAWGAKPGAQSIFDWIQMNKGDYVLFAADDAFRWIARVVGRYENQRAAEVVWGSDPSDGESREFLFFLSQPVAIDTPAGDLEEFLPLSDAEFWRLDEDETQRLEEDSGTVKHFIQQRLLKQGERGPALDVTGIFRHVQRQASESGVFRAVSVTDARAKDFEAIIRRRGQPLFRQLLLRAYEGRCAITGCMVLEALEAAHITPYRGEQTDDVANGLLLRSDIHTLFDLGQLGVNCRDMTVVLADRLQKSSYGVLAGRKLHLPKIPSQQPSAQALELHRSTWGL